MFTPVKFPNIWLGTLPWWHECKLVNLFSFPIPSPNRCPGTMCDRGSHPPGLRVGQRSIKGGNKFQLEKNCSRTLWRGFDRNHVGLKVPLKTYDYVTNSGDVIPMTYICPVDLMTSLLENHLDLLVGGLQCQKEIAENLHAFWQAFQLSHGDHAVFQEHCDNLQSVIPLCWHGDEGRGKSRGNTCVVSLEATIGVQTAVNKKRKRDGRGHQCECNPPARHTQKYNHVDKKLSRSTLSTLKDQWTNQKGLSFMQHWCLFVIPSWVHGAYPQVLPDLLELMSQGLKQLFFEGITLGPRHGHKHFCFAVAAAKGDLKWFCKIALERSFQNQGRVRDHQCCHECLAGDPQSNLTWEDVSENPVWAPSRFSQRPWTRIPPTISIPFCRGAPEKMFKRDPFHCAKLGSYRDHAGSSIIWLCEAGYYGAGDIPTKLQACHRVFQLFCCTIGQSPSLRSFSRSFFMYPRSSEYPWVNAKGSDVTLLLRFICVQCTGFLNALLHPTHDRYMMLIRDTSSAGIKFSAGLHAHGLWNQRNCSMVLHQHLRNFIVGYTTLAASCLNSDFNGWAMKPKIHLLKHGELEMHEWLRDGHEILLNFNMHACEQNEDYVGRVCRLSRRLDSRRIGERVLRCCLIKSRLSYKRFLKQNNLCGSAWCVGKKHWTEVRSWDGEVHFPVPFCSFSIF